MNWKIRVQNPAFWVGMVIGICGIIGSYFGITAPDLTSWQIITDTLGAAIACPYVVGLVIIYILGFFVDLSTVGWKDSTVTKEKSSIDQTAEDIVKAKLQQEAISATTETPEIVATTPKETATAEVPVV